MDPLDCTHIASASHCAPSAGCPQPSFTNEHSSFRFQFGNWCVKPSLYPWFVPANSIVFFLQIQFVCPSQIFLVLPGEGSAARPSEASVKQEVVRQWSSAADEDHLPREWVLLQWNNKVVAPSVANPRRAKVVARGN